MSNSSMTAAALDVDELVVEEEETWITVAPPAGAAEDVVAVAVVVVVVVVVVLLVDRVPLASSFVSMRWQSRGPFVSHCHWGLFMFGTRGGWPHRLSFVPVGSSNTSWLPSHLRAKRQKERGFFLVDFVSSSASSSARTEGPHGGARADGRAKSNQADPHGSKIERLGTRTRRRGGTPSS